MGYTLSSSYSPFDFNWGGQIPSGASSGGLSFSAIPDPTAPNYGLGLNFGSLTPPQIGRSAASVAPYVPSSSPSLVPKTNPNYGPDEKDAPLGLFGWLGKNGDALKNITGLIGGIGEILGGIQTNKIAKQQLGLAREQYQTNLANQISAYNLALEDRVMGRYSDATRTKANTEDYINRHKL